MSRLQQCNLWGAEGMVRSGGTIVCWYVINRSRIVMYSLLVDVCYCAFQDDTWAHLFRNVVYAPFQ